MLLVGCAGLQPRCGRCRGQGRAGDEAENQNEQLFHEKKGHVVLFVSDQSPRIDWALACRSDEAGRRRAAEAEERRNGFVIGNGMNTTPTSNHSRTFQNNFRKTH